MRLPRYLAAAAGVLLLTTAVLLAYGRLLHYPLVCDDVATITLNPSIVQLWPLWSADGAPSPLRPTTNTPVSARPLANLSFALDHHFGGLFPAGYHATNIGIHLLAALLLWALVYRTLRLDFFAARFARTAGLLSFGAALLWALHPLNSECVAYATQRTESLMGLFYVATLLACVGFWHARSRASRIGWWLTATALCSLGALSKEVMASLPAVALLYERTFITGSFRRSLRRSWPLYVGLALEWIPLAAINLYGSRTPAAGFDLGLSAPIWWLTQTQVLLHYLKLTFWPWPLVLHYDIPYLETPATAWPWLVPVLLLGIATVVLVWRRTAAGFVAVCVLAALSPTLVIPCVGETIAERRMYVPLMALVPLLAVGAYAAIECVASSRTRVPRTSARPITAVAVWCAVIAVVGGSLFALTARRVAAYQDARTLLTDAARHQPDDIWILINLGVELANAGQPEDALVHFQHAAELYENSPPLNYRLNRDIGMLYFNIGLAYDGIDRPRAALEYYNRSIELRPDFAYGYFNRGLLRQRLGRLPGAIDDYEAALQIKPELVEAHVNLGALLATAGRYDQAISHLEEAARLEPDAAVYVNLVDAYAQAGRGEDAVEAARTAITLARAAGQDELAEQIEAWLGTFRPASAQP